MNAERADCVISDVADKLSHAHSVAIICHINPDGDTIGSGLALWRALNKLGVKADIFCENKIPEKLKYIDGAENISSSQAFNSRYSMGVAVDCNSADRMGAVYSVFEKAEDRLIIDHHICSRRLDCLHIIDTTCAATAQIIFKILTKIEQNGKKIIDESIAKSLYCALVTDSGAFSFSNVTSETMAIASQLLCYDIKPHKIIEHLIKTVKPNIYNLKCRVLSRTKFFADGKISLINFSADDFSATSTTSEDTEGIINCITDIKGVCVAVAISEVGDMSYKISIRTKEPVRADIIAGIFGGGGHARAAGCRISGYYEDAKDKVIKACTDCL